MSFPKKGASMNHTNPTSASLSNDLPRKNQKSNPSHPVSTAKRKKFRVNWHQAAACAIEIELRDYTGLLQFFREYILGKNSYRIDILVVKKLSGHPVPKNIAHIFKTYNLFEVKGMHSSITISSYYKVIGYAGLLIDQTEACTALDISISFLTFHYPRRLMKHLRKERNLVVEKTAAGIYYISKETFDIQIVVINELLSDENLYLCCLSDRLQDIRLVNRLAEDYSKHSGQELYTNYLQQLTNANFISKGESQMLICEGLLNLYGTSSEEIIAKAKAESDEYYLPKINELTASVSELTSQVDHLKNLLRQNDISFE